MMKKVVEMTARTVLILGFAVAAQTGKAVSVSGVAASQKKVSGVLKPQAVQRANAYYAVKRVRRVADWVKKRPALSETVPGKAKAEDLLGPAFSPEPSDEGSSRSGIPLR